MVTHWRPGGVSVVLGGVTTEQPSLLTEADLVRELRQARLAVDRLLYAIKDFTVLAHETPWVHLDDLLGDLRAASVTVAVLEKLQGSR